MKLPSGEADAPQIPAMVWEILDRIPGTDPREDLEAVYQAIRGCDGLVLLIQPSFRVAVVAILGALESVNQGTARIYAMDVDQPRLALLLLELSNRGLAGGVTLYHGSVHDFFRDLPIRPDLICATLHEEGLDASRFAADFPPDTRFMVLGAAAQDRYPAVVRRMVESGILEPTDANRGGRYYRTTGQCRGIGYVPPELLRVAVQGRLHERYFLSQAGTPAGYTPVADLTEELRRDFSNRNSGASGYGAWPYIAPEPRDLPPTLPGGKAWPRISVITPTFNQGKYIEQTILSVLHQGYPNVEHIIVDGASTDETPRVLERYKDRVALIISEPDRGQSHAINKGMSRATGQILTWINSDDMLAPGALAAIALAFETSGADMVAGICRIYSKGQLVDQHLTCCPEGPLNLQQLLDLDGRWQQGQFFYQPEVMFTRDLWTRAGAHVGEHLHYSMDYEMWLRFAKAGAKLHAIGRPIAWFRIHEEQKTSFLESNFLPELTRCRDAFARQHGTPVPAPAQVRSMRAKLRVTLLNDHGAYYGAGIAHVRLARALALAGHDVKLVSILDKPSSAGARADYTIQSVFDSVAASKPDLVITGNLHNAQADPVLLSLLSAAFPTLVLLHDFWTLTGRCAYTGECEKYLDGCDATCPTANEYPPLAPAEIAEAWLKKRAVLGAADGPSFLANSQWTAEFAKRALAKAARPAESTPPVEVCRLSFPLDIFQPRDQRVCREAFGLPLDRFIILMPASLNDPRKGGLALLEALARLELPDVLVVTLGTVACGVETGIDLVQLGYIQDQRKLAMLYSAVDVIAGPSIVETFGQVFIEGIACGTPVAGYPVAGVREAIVEGVTGVLAADMQPASLAAAIQYLYVRPSLRRDISRWGRMFVENEWSEFSAYRHLFLALERLKLLQAFNLRPKISFPAQNPAAPDLSIVWRGASGWRPRHGFSALETSPEWDLHSFRWAFGPDAFAEVTTESRGLHTVVIGYRNPHEAQRLVLGCNGVTIGTHDLPRTGFGSDRFLLQDVSLEAGLNLLHLKTSRWFQPGKDPRPLALMISDIRAVRVHDEDYPGGQPEPDEMVATVWGGLGQ